MRRLETSHLIRIYTVCHSVIDFFYRNSYLQRQKYPKSEIEVHLRNSAMKGLRDSPAGFGASLVPQDTTCRLPRLYNISNMDMDGIARKYKNPCIRHQNSWNENKHYENTPIHIYRKFHLQKLKLFRCKNTDIFYTSTQNIDCGYSLEPPRRGGSNEYHNLCFKQK